MFVPDTESEVRRLRYRHKIGPIAIVLGAAVFGKMAFPNVVFHRHRPWLLESIRIVYGKVQMQSFAIIEHLITLNNMKAVADRRSVMVDHRFHSVVKTKRVHHERIAFKMTDGMAVPTPRERIRMCLVQINMPRLLIIGVYDRDFVRQLQYLNPAHAQNAR